MTDTAATTTTLDPVRSGMALRSVTAGLVTGSLNIVLGVSVAALAYAALPPDQVGQGIGFTLLGSVVISTILALLSSHAGSVGIPQDSPAAILGLVIATLAGRAAATGEPLSFVTVIAMVVFTTVMTGIAMLILGLLRIGRFIRFIPYPVIGGFLAGTGWLLLVGGLGIMTGMPIALDTLDAHMQPALLMRWVPGVALAVTLVVATRRLSHPMIVPALLGSALVLFYAVLTLAGPLVSEADRAGLFLGPFPAGIVGLPPPPGELVNADWPLILSQGTPIIVLILVSVISMLLNCSGLELATARDIDLNRELKAMGLANLGAAVVGSLPGYHALSSSLVGHKMQANSRLIGLTTASVLLVAAVVGNQMLALLPRAVLGGFVAFLGLSLLVEWLYDAWRRMPRSDYAVIVLILGVVTLGGYLEGVALGTVAASVLFLVEYSRQSVIKHLFTGEVYRSKVIRPENHAADLRRRGHEILIVELQGYIFFGTANKLVEVIRQRVREAVEGDRAVRYLILDFRRVSNLDSSATLSFTRLRQWAEPLGIRLILTSLPPAMAQRLRVHDPGANGGLLLQPEMDLAMEWCENQILTAEAATRLGGFTIDEQLHDVLGAEHGPCVARMLERQTLSAGEYMVRQGDETFDLYFVEVGRLSVMLELPFGKTIRVASAGTGSVLGEIGLYSQRSRTASVIADGPTIVYKLTPEALADLKASEPRAAAALHEYLAGVLATRLADNDAMLQALLA